ncbi:hypothetical protein [Neobacillus niacini]|uniref:hypothetical protein n=1 Tax=Neobacillus niacini TaxID=86668 RepID=UPI002FFF10DF
MGVTNLVLKHLIIVILLNTNDHKKMTFVTRHLYQITIIVPENSIYQELRSQLRVDCDRKNELAKIWVTIMG